MRLRQAFFRLPLRFDVERLRYEVAQFRDADWADHPNNIAGNSSLRLISADGMDNDDIHGVMQPTPYLRSSPYIRQILASFGVVWGRSRLMRLAPGAEVPQHADINYHWFNRVRLHIPVVTQPEVLFRCDDRTVHMAAGEAWLFDSWRQHSVVNPTAQERIHLVADTTGSASFWDFVIESEASNQGDKMIAFDSKKDAMPLTEIAILPPVMPPAELDLLLLDLRTELTSIVGLADGPLRLNRYHSMLEALSRDWRQLYLLYGTDSSGYTEFAKLRDSVRSASRSVADGLIMRSNRVPAHAVLEGRVLTSMLRPTESRVSVRLRQAAPTRPVFIVAAPRSGSTLLFESLAANSAFATLGGEAHWLIEGIEELRPGAAGVDSNRLTEMHFSDEVSRRVRKSIEERLCDSQGQPVSLSPAVRLLEKTPKNSLRIPFLNRLFPDAQFVFLWRDPRENISSIMEAWRSGRWKTYNGLPGFDGPWSLLLPPGWQIMNGRPLEEIAAFQWDSANRIILDDLSLLPRQRWIALEYDALIAHPQDALSEICRFVGVNVEEELRDRWSQPLPLSRYTQTPPQRDKWRQNQSEIENVLPTIDLTWRRLQALNR